MSQSTNVYPQGNTSFYRKYVLGALKFFKHSNHTEIFSIDGPYARLSYSGQLFTERHRVTLAEVKAGHTLLPAVPGYKYQLVDLTLVAVGGNAITADSVDVAGTQGGLPALLAVTAVAGLTQNTRVSLAESADSVILADGLSFAPCDANTAITIADAGVGELAGPTNIDAIIKYTLVKV